MTTGRQRPSKALGGQVAKPRKFEKLRIDHSAKLTARVKRRISAGPNLKFELEKRAFPKTVINGTMLERIVAKQVHDRGFRFEHQYDVTLPNMTQARIDIAVFGTGISEPLGIEPHGLVWHTDDEKDAMRDAMLRQKNIFVVYLWEDDLINQEERMHAVIDEALRGYGRPGPLDMPTPIQF